MISKCNDIDNFPLFPLERSIQQEGSHYFDNNCNGIYSDTKLEWILKKYRVNNNDIDDTELE